MIPGEQYSQTEFQLQPQQFDYPTNMKGLFALGTCFGFGLPVALLITTLVESDPDESMLEIASLCVGVSLVGLASLYCLWQILSRITISERGVTHLHSVTRKHHHLDWEVIKYIRERPYLCQIELRRSPAEKPVIIHYQLIDYVRARNIIMDQVQPVNPYNPTSNDRLLRPTDSGDLMIGKNIAITSTEFQSRDFAHGYRAIPIRSITDVEITHTTGKHSSLNFSVSIHYMAWESEAAANDPDIQPDILELSLASPSITGQGLKRLLEDAAQLARICDEQGTPFVPADLPENIKHDVDDTAA